MFDSEPLLFCFLFLEFDFRRQKLCCFMQGLSDLQPLRQKTVYCFPHGKGTDDAQNLPAHFHLPSGPYTALSLPVSLDFMP